MFLILFSLLLVRPVQESEFKMDNSKTERVFRKQLEKERFLMDLRKGESGENWKRINKWGYMGYYQFGVSALKAIGMHITPDSFKLDSSIFLPERQQLAANLWFDYLELKLDTVIKEYEGMVIFDRITVTKSGILAAAHLGGVTGVKRLFNTGHVAADQNGTSLVDYMSKYGGYEF